MSTSQNDFQIYTQLCTSYHAIDDFRAKLLGLLPFATGAGMLLLLDKLQTIQTLPSDIKNLFAATGIFGVLITLGLFAYEIYGIKKCAALTEAGQRLEIALQLENGQFRNRPRNVAYVINEAFAAGVIYPTVLAGWTFFALAFAWPPANPSLPLVVLLSGLAIMLGFEFLLSKEGTQSSCYEQHEPKPGTTTR